MTKRDPTTLHGAPTSRLPVAVVAAYPEELSALRQRLGRPRKTRLGSGVLVVGRLANRPALLMPTGDGATKAQLGVESLLASFEVAAVIGIGVAGALSPDLEAGSVVAGGTLIGEGDSPAPPDPQLLALARRQTGVVEGTILSHTAIATQPDVKARLWRQVDHRPAAVVDLESVTYAAVATARRLPFLAIRAVSDPHDEALPLDFNRLRGATGGILRARVVLQALRHPAVIPGLVRLRSRVRYCSRRLADIVEGMLGS